MLLEVKNLYKCFRSHWTFRARQALNNVSLTVERGDVLGLIGQNGAGKTTTIKSIVGLLRPDRGEIAFRGVPLRTAGQRAEIGYLPELPYFYENLSVTDTLTLYGKLCDIKEPALQKRIDELLELFSLEDRRYTKISALSKGLKQRVGFAQAIINNPSLLILDEPFSGLDPIARHEFKQIIRRLRDGGTSILISSHVLTDLEELCNRVTIIAAGEVKRELYMSELGSLRKKGYQLEIEHNDAKGFAQLISSFAPDSVEESTYSIILHFTDEKAAQSALDQCCKSELKVLKFTTTALSLEELFVEINSNLGESDAKNSNDSALHLS